MRTFIRGEEGYEAARRDAVWNGLLPPRFPEVIVQASNEADVIAAVRMAADKGLKIGVRSGGHSWAASHLRDGGMLLDVSRLRDVTIDKVGMQAAVGPGCKGNDVLGALLKKRLFFPVGHCIGVGLGGFLLQGGYGWDSRRLGPACQSVLGIDVVTAGGGKIYASETENQDWYWAARGSGPGFFGVVTRFHLRVYPRPKIVGAVVQHYSVEHLEEVFRWAHEVGRDVRQSVELMLLMSRHVPGVRGPGIVVVAPVIANTLDEVRAATTFMQRSPVRGKAALSLPFVPCGFRLLLRGVRQHYPDGYKYAVDNMWTAASIDELMPHLKRIAETLPPAPSHVLWMNWMPPPHRPDMAYSVEDDIYLALYAAWNDVSYEEECKRWPVERMKDMEKLASGIQLADENLAQRPARFMTDEHMQKLDALRGSLDPDSRFHSWMGRL